MTLDFQRADRSRAGFSKFRIVRALQTLFATLKARAALRRIAHYQRVHTLDDIPAHLRRDLGLPEVDQARWANDIAILAHLRLK